MSALCQRQTLNGIESSYFCFARRIIFWGFEGRFLASLADPSADFVSDTFEDIRPGVGCAVNKSKSEVNSACRHGAALIRRSDGYIEYGCAATWRAGHDISNEEWKIIEERAACWNLRVMKKLRKCSRRYRSVGGSNEPRCPF
jgi:hypothetical protein